MLYEEPALIEVESNKILECSAYLTIPDTPSAKLIAGILLPDTKAFSDNCFDRTIAL